MKGKRREVKIRDMRSGRHFQVGLKWISCLIAYAIVTLLVVSSLMPRQQSLTVGNPAPATIKAPRQVVDTLTTERKKESARATVADMYKQDEQISQTVIGDVEAVYTRMDEVRKKAAEEFTAWQQNQQIIAQTQTEPDQTNDSKAQPTEPPVFSYSAALMTTAAETVPIGLGKEEMTYLLGMNQNDLSALEEEAIRLMRQALSGGIKEVYLNEQIGRINQELMSPMHGFSSSAQRIGMNLVSTYLKANLLLDLDATRAAQDKAAEQVNEEIYKAGQNIVLEGEPVTEAQLQVIKDLGMLKEEGIDWWRMASLAVLVGVVFIGFWIYMSIFQTEIFASLLKMSIINLMLSLTTLFFFVVGRIHIYLLPGALGALLIALLVDHRTGFVANILLALVAGLLGGAGNGVNLTDGALVTAIAIFAGGSISIQVVYRSPQRTTIFVAGLLSGLVAAVVYTASVFSDSAQWEELLLNAGRALGGGLLASVTCLGTLPFWEWLFHVVTPMKLLELANPNQPLLKRLLMEAPGTYHHSIVVGNLAENAAEILGANALLTRTAAYYHDVGKLKRPYFFKENQSAGENPHDPLDPALSAKIICSHTTEGYEMAKDARLPEPILEIIRSHHGTTLVTYFYHKALEKHTEGDSPDPADFTYPGPLPQTREAAIIMLADSVEAATRSLKEHTTEKINEMVDRVMAGKLESGQFKQCALTMRDMDTMAAAFKSVLSGVYHERIEYPSMEGLKKQRTTDQ